jgi:hypothetical protein
MDAQTQQMIQQLQAQLQQQALQLQQQAQQLLQQQQAAASVAVSAVQPVAGAHSGRSLARPRTPSTFNATDRPGELDQWEREMRYQFAAYGAALASDEARIAHAVSFLGAVPLQWWDANPSHRDVASWGEFVHLLRERFRPVNAAKLARIELFKLRQGASTTAGAHAARFQELLVSLPHMHEEDRIHLFVHSLSTALKRRVGDREFTTLSAAINAAVQSEGLYEASSATDAVAQVPWTRASYGAGSTAMVDVNYMQEGSASSLQVAPGGPLSVRSHAHQLAAMQEELNAMRSQLQSQSGRAPSRAGRVGDLDASTLQKRLADGACLRCGSRAHWKSECPESTNFKSQH